jgi:transcriptional regulator with XRE-family HTH domain
MVPVEHLDKAPTPEQHFGAMVRQAREARDWTQESLRRHLADRGVHLEKTAMIRLEQGRRPIRLNEVAVLAKLLGLDLKAYTSSMPQLTAREYAAAKTDLQRVIREQEQAAGRSAELESGLAEVMRTRRDLADQRAHLEWLVGEYEFEHGISDGQATDGDR